MFGKVCGYVITGATTVMMAGMAVLTGIWVKDEVDKRKRVKEIEKWAKDAYEKED